MTPTNTPGGICSATVALVGTANVNTGTTGTTLSVTVGASGVAAGNNILVGLTMDQTAGAVSCSDSAGNLYSVEVDLNNGTDLRTLIVAADNVAGLVNGNSISCTHPSTGNARNLSVETVAGISGPFDQKTGSSGSSTTPSSGTTALTAQANEVLYGVIGHRGFTNDFTAGAGYTRIGAVGSNGGGIRATEPEYRIVAATGQYAADGTLGIARNWAAGILTLRCQ